MTIYLNGEKRAELSAGTIAGLVDELKLPAPTILIEHNGIALRRDEWSSTMLAEADRIEIVRVVAGG